MSRAIQRIRCPYSTFQVHGISKDPLGGRRLLRNPEHQIPGVSNAGAYEIPAVAERKTAPAQRKRKAAS